ncbi:unnamed protein product [Prorocentrum cordatum]|uniref:Uncharacterized protein n=1 Tax=Prorocentrum cordatum TaxID=2364126 RepID=A0ABN9RZP5_9DINO|nr:unnamed protein product [Polarella glacialis]
MNLSPRGAECLLWLWQLFRWQSWRRLRLQQRCGEAWDEDALAPGLSQCACWAAVAVYLAKQLPLNEGRVRDASACSLATAWASGTVGRGRLSSASASPAKTGWRWSSRAPQQRSTISNHQDLLTIPVAYHETIVSMVEECPGGEAEGLLTALLDAGRRVFVEAGVGGAGRVEAEMQCVHLPGAISVHWLHVHTFIGEVGNGEDLPARPPGAVCALVNMTSAEAARHMLAHAI